MAVYHKDSQRRFSIDEDGSKGDRLTLRFLKSVLSRWPHNKDINSTKSYAEGKDKEANKDWLINYAENLLDELEEAGRGLQEVDHLKKNQSLVLVNQLQRLGCDASEILQAAIEIAKDGLNPVEAIAWGKEIVSTSKNYAAHNLDYFIEAYSNDPTAKKNSTHKQTVRDFRSLHKHHQLGDIPFVEFFNKTKALEAIRRVLQAYCDREGVTAEASLTHYREKLKTLLKFMQDLSDIPTSETIRHCLNIDKLKLDHNLQPPRPRYSFNAGEILVFIKYFSQRRSFEPMWPIVMVFMGCRTESFEHYEWSFLNRTSRRKKWEIRIPWQLTKLGRQKRLTQDIVFTVDKVPNLALWLLYGDRAFDERGRGRKKTINHLKYHARQNHANKCLKQYRHLFECIPEGIKNLPDDEVPKGLWETYCSNGFRRSWFTYGMKHEVVKKSCQKLGNDYKSIDKYTDTEDSDPEFEADVLFSMTPDYLHLVNLDNGTVNTDFLYASPDKKKEMWRGETDPQTKEVFQSCLESQGIIVDRQSLVFLDVDSFWENRYRVFEYRQFLKQHYKVINKEVINISGEDPLGVMSKKRYSITTNAHRQFLRLCRQEFDEQ